jgi:hypothetical protein
MMRLEVGEPHLNLLALIARLLELRRARQCAGEIAGSKAPASREESASIRVKPPKLGSRAVRRKPGLNIRLDDAERAAVRRVPVARIQHKKYAN